MQPSDKELKRMQKELKKHLDMDWIEDMFIYSFRYTLGRMSYSPGVCMDFLTPCIPYLGNKTLELISREIGEYPFDGTQYPDEWYRFKNKIDEEINQRRTD